MEQQMVGYYSDHKHNLRDYHAAKKKGCKTLSDKIFFITEGSPLLTDGSAHSLPSTEWMNVNSQITENICSEDEVSANIVDL